MAEMGAATVRVNDKCDAEFLAPRRFEATIFAMKA